MPLSSLNRIEIDRQLAPLGAWQHGIGLPEGALTEPRLNTTSRICPTPTRTSIFVFICLRVSQRARVPASVRLNLTDRRHPTLCAGRGSMEDGVLHMQMRYHRPTAAKTASRTTLTQGLKREQRLWYLLRWQHSLKHPPCRA